MQTDDLIRTLAGEAAPVRPLAAPTARALAYGGLCLAFVIGGVAIWGVRPDVRAVVARPMFLALAALTALTAAAAAERAFVSSVPGADAWRPGRWLPIGLALAWAAVLVVAIALGAAPEPAHGAGGFTGTCVFKILTLSVLPGALLFVMIRRAVPLDPGWTAGLAALAAASAAALGVQFICPIDAPAHLLQSHLGPTALIGLGVGSVFHSLRRFGARSRRRA